MVADDEVGAAVDRRPGKVLLALEWRRVVLGAPVGEDDDDLRPRVARLLDVLGDDLRR